MNRNFTTTALLLITLAAAGGCEGDPRVAVLATYDLEVTALDDLHQQDRTASRSLFFSMRQKTGTGNRSGCATLAGATIRYNGRPIRPNIPGGWYEQRGWERRPGCEAPSVIVTVDEQAREPSDATLEIEDGQAHVVVTVPGLHVRRDLVVTSVSPDTAVVRAAPSAAHGLARAWLRDDVTMPGRKLETTIVGDDIQLALAGERGRQTLNVRLDFDDVAVARCQGVLSCKATASVFRQQVIDIP